MELQIWSIDDFLVFRFPLIPTLTLLMVACTGDPRVLKQKYLEAGDRYFAKNRFREASIMYRTALRKDPRFGEAHYRNAIAQIRLSQIGPAEASLRRAIELLPESSQRLTARVQLADIYLAYMDQVQRDRQAMKEVDRLCGEILSLDSKSFDGHRLRGALSNLKAVEQSANYPNEASEELRKAILDLRAADSIRPYNPEVVSSLTRALWANKQPDEAERYLRALLRAQPAFVSGYSELSRFYTKNNRLKDAEEILQQATEKVPGHVQFFVQLAEFYQKSGRRADMARTLDRLKTQAAGFQATYEVAGRLFLDAGDPEQAIREYEEGIRRFPNDKAVYQKSIVDALTAQNKKAEAKNLNDRILHERPNDAAALVWQAGYLLQNGDVAKAIAGLEAVLQRAPNHPLAHYTLGRAWLASQRREDARFQFAEAIRSAPDFILARIALTKVQIGTGEYGSAVASADQILALDTRQGEARLYRAIALRLMGKLDEARAEIKTLLAMYPQYDEALFQVGELYAAEHKWKEAEAAYRKSYEANPANIEGLLAIAFLQMARNEVDKAVGTVRSEATRNPGRLDLRLAHGAIASRADRRDEAAAEYKLLLTKFEQNPKALGDINLRLGELYFRTGDAQQSLGYLERAKQLRPDDPAALHSLGVAYDVLGRRKEASALYEACLKIDNQNPVVMNNLAYYISQNGGDLDQALTYAQRARQRMPNELGFSDTVAYIYLKKNLVENALEILEDLVQKKPDNAAFRLHLGEALLKKRDVFRAKKQLRAALLSKPTAEDTLKIQDLLAKVGI